VVQCLGDEPGPTALACLLLLQLLMLMLMLKICVHGVTIPRLSLFWSAPAVEYRAGRRHHSPSELNFVMLDAEASAYVV
jgi:hypothetical protein